MKHAWQSSFMGIIFNANKAVGLVMGKGCGVNKGFFYLQHINCKYLL